MKRYRPPMEIPRKQRRGTTLAFTLLWVLCLNSITFAQLDPGEKDEKSAARRPIHFVSASTNNVLEKVQRLLEEKNFTEASSKLSALLNAVKHRKLDTAYVMRAYGYFYAEQGNYKNAAAYFEKALAEKSLPDASRGNLLYNLLQSYLASEQYKLVVDKQHLWLQEENHPTAQVYMSIGTALLQLDRYQEALSPINQAIALSEKSNETWYQTLLAVYYQLEQYSNCVNVLEKLISLFSQNKQYWLQLSSVHLVSGNEIRAAAVLEMALRIGALASSEEHCRLAALYLQIGTPYKAGEFLTDNLRNKTIESTAKNWELLANSWFLAKELPKAEKALSQAAELSNNGQLYLRLGQFHLEQEAWPQAAQAFRQALEKGSLKNPGGTYLMLGYTLHELKQRQEAKKAFTQATQYPNTKKTAEQWLNGY